MDSSSELTERDRRLLAFERRWRGHTGRKEEAIRATFGLPAARYYQLVNALIDSPAALAADPQLVYALRAARGERVQARARNTFRVLLPESV